MALWGNKDQANNAPKFVVLAGTDTSSGVDGFANTGTDVTVATANVNTGTETITIASHGFSNGDQVRYLNGGGTSIGGLTTNTVYYVIKTGTNTFKLANTLDDVTGNNPINLSGTGNNSQKISTKDLTYQRYTSAYGNTDVDAFTAGMAFGVFGVDATEAAVNQAAGKGEVTPGWNAVRIGTGPVVEFSVAAPGSGFVNGESITVSGGTVNSTGIIATNATAYMTSVSIADPGAGFTNNSVLTVAFNREKHVATISGTNLQAFSNTSKLVVSGGTVNAVATIVTDGNGNTVSFTITSKGLFANTATNGTLVFHVANSSSNSTFTGTGSITGNTVAAGFSGTVGTSTGGNVTVTLGGRAGRVQYESLVAMRITTDNSGDDSVFPNS